jgi:DNA-binding transcriptional regulator YhcF (GntR family)
MSPRKSKEPKGGTVNVVFGKYLKDLEAAESAKPLEARRRVPSIEDLAPVIGVHPVTLRNIANSNIKHLDLVTAGKIISTMRRLGFAMSEQNLIQYTPDQ